MFAVCVTRLSTRETKISTNVFADRSAATLRHLGYICTIVNRFFKLCISSPSSLSLFISWSMGYATRVQKYVTRQRLVPSLSLFTTAWHPRFSHRQMAVNRYIWPPWFPPVVMEDGKLIFYFSLKEAVFIFWKRVSCLFRELN